MKVLVNYDSIFGTIEKKAPLITTAIAPQAIAVGNVDANQLHDLNLMECICKLINSLSNNQLAGALVATFDRRIVLDTIGYAALTIAQLLEKKGGQLAPPSEGYR